jgi:hypothetical protein
MQSLFRVAEARHVLATSGRDRPALVRPFRATGEVVSRAVGRNPGVSQSVEAQHVLANPVNAFGPNRDIGPWSDVFSSLLPIE